MKTERYYWLDAVRGIAALIVVFSHMATFGLYANEPYWSVAQLPPLRLLWSGHQAVIVFFVLSGFALYMLCETVPLTAARFVWARFLRIYPPYLVAVMLAIASLKIPLWLGVTWPPKNIGIPNGIFTFSDVVDHVLMIGFFQVKSINPPIWSLVYEMRLSILFPIIYWCVSRTTWRMLAFPVMFTCAFSAMLFHPRITNDLANHPAIVDVFRTIHFAGMFFVGAYLAKYRTELSFFISSKSLAWKFAAGTAAFILYLYSFEYTWTQWPRYIGELGTALAAAYFIALAIAATSRPPTILIWLGRISFSLYLTHHAVIHIAALFGYGAMPTPFLWALILATSILTALTFYSTVELPSHRLSKDALRPALSPAII